MRYRKAHPAAEVIMAAALLLSACEPFHYGDKIRYRGAEVALLNYPEEQAPQNTQSHRDGRGLYRPDGKLYERAILTYAPLTHVAAWYRMAPLQDIELWLRADGAWLWRRRRLPQGAREYAAWLLLPLLFVLPFFVVAMMMQTNAPFGPILAIIVTALYAVLQTVIALLLLPCAMLFCRLVRRTAA